MEKTPRSSGDSPPKTATSPAAAGEHEAELRRERERFKRATEALRSQHLRIRSLENDLRGLQEWLAHLRDGVEAILGSRRWRLGNGLIGTFGRLIGLPRTPPHIEHMGESLRAFTEWQHQDDEARRPELDDDTVLSDAPGAALPSWGSQPSWHRHDVIVLANIEWRQRFQRPQQMALQFAKQGHRVFYLVASHASSIDPEAGYRSEQVAENVFEIELACAANVDRYAAPFDTSTCESFLASIDRVAAFFDIAGAVIFVHLPSWTPLALRLQQDWGAPLVYDCMDDWRDFPLIGKPVVDAEAELVDSADLVTVTSPLLAEKWKATARSCVLVRNGVDAAWFESHVRPNRVLQDRTGPVIGYYGALAEWVDFELLSELARRRPAWKFVLVGDVFVEDLAGLDALANVHILGRQPFEKMPLYLYHFDVCLIPFRIDDMTHAVDPVKLYEYLSVGKPVVAARLQSLESYRDLVYLAEGPDETLEQLDAAIREHDPALSKQRRALARESDWSQRYETTRAAIAEITQSLSIVVVSFENVELTRQCVESVLGNTLHPDFELIVVDNGSQDGSATYLRQLEIREPNVRVILNDENLGFAAANNQGLALARGDLLAILNNDTVVPRGWAHPLARHLRDPEIGLVGPVTNFAGNEARIAVPYTRLEEMQGFASSHMRSESGRCFEIAVLAMFCVMLRRDVYQVIGPLDEGFEIGMFEDDDYAQRIRQKGLRVVCAEDSFVHHVGQASFGKLIESGEYQRIWDTNLAYYEKKWGRWEPHQHRPAHEE